MKVALSPSYELNDERSASFYGQAILVNLGNGEAFGPGDILKPYPSWEFQLASEAVERMTRSKKLALDERLFVDDFINFGK